MKIRFYRFCGVWQIISLFVTRKTNSESYYFDISLAGKIMRHLLRMNDYVRPLDFIIADIKNERGESCLEKWKKDQLALTNLITDGFFNKSGLFAYFSNILNTEKLINFYRLDINNKIDEFVAFLNVIDWYKDKSSQKNITETEFFIKRVNISVIMKNFAAREYNIDIYTVFSFRDTGFWQFCKGVQYLFLLLFETMLPLKNAIFLKRNIKRDNTYPLSLIAASYAMRGLTLDASKRCDFPWLLYSDIPRQQVLIYFEREDFVLTDAILDILAKQKIKCLAMSKRIAGNSNVEIFSPSLMFSRKATDLVMHFFYVLCFDLIHGKRAIFTYMPLTLIFIKEYAKFYDFYKTYNIKINIDFVEHNPLKVAHSIALKNTGGISISYQVSNWPLPNAILGSYADIFFMFGPHYKKILMESGAKNDTVVLCGYISDYAFKGAEQHAQNLRSQLLNSGAKFIVAFFDENPSSAKMSTLPTDRLTRVYKIFLDWLITDKSLGLIISSKRPRSLLKSLPGIYEDARNAKDTGRCIFMDGDYAAHAYPVETGLASDVSVCLLGGGTTALENYLAGVRTVFLDLEGFYSFDEYRWGKDTLVFDNLKKLIQAINKFSAKRSDFDEFGNPSLVSNLNAKDPFRDGKASMRMGEYINSLQEMFNKKRTREEAIQYANERYAETWGKEYVLK